MDCVVRSIARHSDLWRRALGRYIREPAAGPSPTISLRPARRLAVRDASTRVWWLSICRRATRIRSVRL